jgi:hypothetical protein
VSNTSVIEQAKASVSTIDLADLLCSPGQMQRRGENWIARCLITMSVHRRSSCTPESAAGGASGAGTTTAAVNTAIVGLVEDDAKDFERMQLCQTKM